MKAKKLTATAKFPVKGSASAAGYDLYADSVDVDPVNGCVVDGDKILVPAGRSVIVHTGIAISIPEGFVGLIFPRSGLAVKQGLRLQNSVGVIDSDYRGEVLVVLHADGPKTAEFKLGDRVAQIVFIRHAEALMEEVEELDETERGSGGFGSTGN